MLDHLVEAWPAGATRVWCDELATALATAWPGRYDGWTGEQVTAAVKPHGITTVQVKRTTLGRQANRRGLDLADVRAAHEATAALSTTPHQHRTAAPPAPRAARRTTTRRPGDPATGSTLLPAPLPR